MSPAVMPAPQSNEPTQQFTAVSMHDYMMIQYRKYGGKIDPSYPEGPYIFGVRNEDMIKDSVWNDLIGILYNGKIYVTLATTDPGSYWTFNRMDPRGCFHMKPCFQENIWRLGRHMGYPALTNTGSVGHVKGWRDGNNNLLYDEGVDIDDEGIYAINCHHGWSTTGSIGKHSAGCQVILNKEVFEFYYNSLIAGSRKGQEMKGEARFSYMLFMDNQVPYSKLMKLSEQPYVGH